MLTFTSYVTIIRSHSKPKMLHEGIVEINSAKDLAGKKMGLHFSKLGVDVYNEDTMGQLVFWIDEIMNYIVPV